MGAVVAVIDALRGDFSVQVEAHAGDQELEPLFRHRGRRSLVDLQRFPVHQGPDLVPVRRPRSQLKPAVVEYVSWFNHERLLASLGDRSPVESESLYVRREAQLSIPLELETNTHRLQAALEYADSVEPGWNAWLPLAFVSIVRELDPGHAKPPGKLDLRR